jgi:S-adenosylmethionine synthetase
VTVDDEGKIKTSVGCKTYRRDADGPEELILKTTMDFIDAHTENVDSPPNINMMGDRLEFNGVTIFVNPTGKFSYCGPRADCGLTGRKIIANTYGGYAPHGGGAFCGKDPTKVDRSGAYAARNAAKSILQIMKGAYPEYGVKSCTVQIGYGIGLVDPVSLDIKLEAPRDEAKSLIPKQAVLNGAASRLEGYILESGILRPRAIIDRFDLTHVRYSELPLYYGHFGNPSFPWEVVNTDLGKVI